VSHMHTVLRGAIAQGDSQDGDEGHVPAPVAPHVEDAVYVDRLSS
jgi:hypothetical protein